MEAVPSPVELVIVLSSATSVSSDLDLPNLDRKSVV